uniref:Uncharacterized protein n=1 Tax=Romanomermis culicivorax TaxID=13658 RepID=A0A915HYD8_ROMCU
MVNDIATKNLTDQLTTPPRRWRIITPCSSKDWTQFVQSSSDDEEEACEEMNNKKKKKNRKNRLYDDANNLTKI